MRGFKKANNKNQQRKVGKSSKLQKFWKLFYQLKILENVQESQLQVMFLLENVRKSTFQDSLMDAPSWKCLELTFQGDFFFEIFENFQLIYKEENKEIDF